MDIPKTKRVADLTVEELLSLWDDEVKTIVQRAVENQTYVAGTNNPRPPLYLPVDDLGPWPEGLSLRREDMYGDDER